MAVAESMGQISHGTAADVPAEEISAPSPPVVAVQIPVVPVKPLVSLVQHKLTIKPKIKIAVANKTSNATVSIIQKAKPIIQK